MKNFVKILIFSLFSITTYAQQATEIDSKSVKLPRYADLAAIQAAIPTAQQGMMVYNVGTASNWYYNGSAWTNMEISTVSIPTPLDLVSNANTFSSETQDGTSNAIIGLNSSNGAGNGIYGQHKGNGWAGYFLGNNAISANGKSYLNGNVEITNSNWLEFGKGLTKQEDNGKIAYNAFGEANTLSIVGGGIANDGSDRKIKMWANGGTIFNGGASFDKSVNIGSFDLEPIARLQVSSAATSEAPSIAIIDTAPDNQNGGILQFRNQTGLHRFDIQGLFGLQSLPIDSYLSFNKNGSPIMRLRGDGRLGLGVIDPSEKIDLVGNIQLDGEIKPNGISGTAGQVLSSNGDGTMKWGDAGSIFGQVIEVSPWLADTAALRTSGYKLIGDKTQIVNKGGKQIGNTIYHPNGNFFYEHESEIFFSLTLNKLFIVGKTGSGISTFDLNDATYGNRESFATVNYDLTNTKALFTGSKIMIYPYFIFDCATGASQPFPVNSCSGITVTKAQVWTGSKLILYGPTGGFKYDHVTGTFTCIETLTGNLYRPGCSATWTGNLVIFYGGYITVSGNKISADGGLTYNPTTNLWDDIPVGGPRVHNHNAIWTGSEILFLGGQLDNYTTYGNSQSNLYNPVSFAWNVGFTPNLDGIGSLENTKSIISNNKIFCFGVTTNGSLSGAKKVHNKFFDIPTRTWVNFTPSYSHKYENYSVLPVAIPNSILYFSNSDPTNRCGGSALAHLLETASTPSIMPAWNANIFTESPKINNGKYVLVVGNLGAGWLYNSDNSRWIKTNSTNLPSNRTNHFFKPIEGSNKFLIWGGLNGTSFLQNGAIYNISSNTWTPISVSNAPTENLPGAIGNGKVLFWGTSSGKIYDIATNTWTNVSNVNAPTSVGSFESFGNKFIHSSTNGIKYYFPTTNTWTDEPISQVIYNGKKAGKYFYNPFNALNTETNEVKLVDFTDFITPSYLYFLKPHDELSFLKLNTEYPSEIMNLETGVISYVRIQSNAGISANYRNNEVLRISPSKLLLLGGVLTEFTCGENIEGSEALQFVDNTETNVTVSLNLKTLVYKKK
jgi:hypothetical protein